VKKKEEKGWQSAVKNVASKAGNSELANKVAALLGVRR
jgi:hypothetical protein